jgi:hypothetical protein
MWKRLQNQRTLLFRVENKHLQKKNEALISTWERKVLRKIFGPVNERNVWRIRSNQGLRRMYQDLDLVTTIRKSRLKWLGHVHRMSSQRDQKWHWKEILEEDDGRADLVKGG